MTPVVRHGLTSQSLSKGASGLIGRDVSLAVVCFGDQLKTGEMTTAEFLDAAVDLGFKSVELCDRTIKDRDAIAGELASRGLSLPSIALRNDFTGAADTLAGQIEHLHDWLGVAATVGCAIVRVWTGWQRDDFVGRRQIVEAFDQVAEHARQLGVVLAVETHGGASNDPVFLRELCSRYPAGTVGVCPDFGNLPARQRHDAIAELADIANHVHVKSYDFDEAGVETSVPLEWAVRRLVAAGYGGQWVIEYEGGPPYDRGIRLTVETLRRARNLPVDDAEEATC